MMSPRSSITDMDNRVFQKYIENLKFLIFTGFDRARGPSDLKRFSAKFGLNRLIFRGCAFLTIFNDTFQKSS